MTKSYQRYYVPDQSKWPIIASIAMGFFAVGSAGFFQGASWGPWVFLLSVIGIIYMMVGWFSNVIDESQQGLYSKQMDRTFRWGMFWFIFSEVMFFVGFFGALFYMRALSVPWLGGADNNAATHQFLWPNFTATWPLLQVPNPEKFDNVGKAMGAWGLPAINTLILIISSFTITFAHHALQHNKRESLKMWLGATIALGTVFLFCQGYEYYHAYTELDLKLTSGAYGSTFYMLTGFHGAHVTIGTIMLITMLFRVLKGHFKPSSHFAFEATAWYWHFVDVVWLFLFVYVYILPLK